MTSVPGAGLRVSVNGQQKGSEISGDDFYKAMLKIWWVRSLLTPDLKSALLVATDRPEARAVANLMRRFVKSWHFLAAEHKLRVCTDLSHRGLCR